METRAVFFTSSTVWLTPNELTRSQLIEKIMEAEVKGPSSPLPAETLKAPLNCGGVLPLRGAENSGRAHPRLETFSSLESRLSAELSPPEVDDLSRSFILNKLARPLAEHLGLAGDGLKALSPADLPALAENLGDGLDRLKLSALGWDQVAQLPPVELGSLLADLGREHDRKLAEMGRIDRFSRRRLMLDELKAGRPFKALAGVEKIICRWSQRLSPFETDFIIALAQGRQVEVSLKVPSWVLEENIDHGAGFDLLRSIRQLEKCELPTLWLEFGDFSASPPALGYAADTLLAPQPPQPKKAPEADGQIRIIKTPTAYQEVEEAGRLLKQRLAEGLAPERLALVAPDLNTYGAFIDDISRRFGLAFHLRRGVPLAEQGPVRAALDLLALWNSDWERSRLTEILRSPYFIFESRGDGRSLDPAEINRLTLAAGITDRRAGGGFENLAKASGRDSSGLARKILKIHRRLQSAGALLASAPDWGQFFNIFKNVLNELMWPGRLDLAPTGPVNLRGADLASAQAFKEELEKLEEALIQSPEAPEPGLAAFRLWLEKLVGQRHLVWDGSPAGRIRALNYHDLHGGEFDEIFFLGLNEHVFPRTGAEANWWPEELAKAASALLGRPLWNDQADSYRQDELLLAAGLGQARSRVWLFYHDGDESGRTALPSPLLTALKELWPEGALMEETAGWSLPPRLHQAAGADEERVALMALGRDNWPAEFKNDPQRQKMADALIARSRRWREMKKGVKLSPPTVARWLSLRQSHNGAPLVIPAFPASFAACPLAFWASEIMAVGDDGQALEEWPKTSEGDIVHKVLEKFFQPRLGREWPGEDGREELLSELSGLLEAEIKEHAASKPLGRMPLWETRRQRLAEILSRWLDRELAAETPAVRPVKLEWSFGPDENDAAPPFEMKLSDGRSIYFKGRVDRIDETGRGLAVRDYKLSAGAASRFKINTEGDELQAPPAVWPILIYALAAEKALGRTVESSFEIINPGDKDGRIEAPATDDPSLKSSNDTGFKHLIEKVWTEMEQGLFAPKGDESQCGWCALSLICPGSDADEDEEPSA